MRIIATDKAPKAIGPYSQALAATVSEMVFLSGQIPLDPETGNLVEGGIEAQTTQVLRNIEAVLAASGMTKANVVKTTIFLTDLNDFQTANTLYAEYFGEHRPARSTVQVAGLPRGALVEIETIAVR